MTKKELKLRHEFINSCSTYNDPSSVRMAEIGREFLHHTPEQMRICFTLLGYKIDYVDDDLRQNIRLSTSDNKLIQQLIIIPDSCDWCEWAILVRFLYGAESYKGNP